MIKYLIFCFFFIRIICILLNVYVYMFKFSDIVDNADRSHQASRNRFASSSSSLSNILSSQSILVLDFDLIDQISSDFFLLHCVHDIDFNRVITTFFISYLWTMTQPPVWIYSSATPLTSPLSLSLINPGGSTWIDEGYLFWITITESTSLVMILLNPVKFSTIVSRLGVRYCMECGKLARFVSFWLKRGRRVGMWSNGKRGLWICWRSSTAI